MQLKPCRYCAEEIKEAARICPFCQKPTGRGLFIDDEAWSVITVIIVGGACMFFGFRLFGSREFSKYRNDIVVTDSKIVSRLKSGGANAPAEDKVIATVTNKGRHAWAIDRVEVRFYDGERKMIDAMEGVVSASVLPRSARAFGIDLRGRPIRTNAVTPQVLIKDAREATEPEKVD